VSARQLPRAVAVTVGGWSALIAATAPRALSASHGQRSTGYTVTMELTGPRPPCTTGRPAFSSRSTRHTHTLMTQRMPMRSTAALT